MLQCRHKSEWVDAKFCIVDVPDSAPAIAGLPLIEALELITIHCAISQHNTTSTKADVRKPKIYTLEDLKREYPQQFDRVGKLPGKARLHLRDDAVPTCDPPRKVPIHIREKLQEELDRMEEEGVVRRVTEHSDWCSSLTTTIKPNGSLRVCLDPRQLNKALKRCPYKILTVEEITHKFHGARYFSKLDAMHGYWGVELEEDSQLLTTFRAPNGRYCFQRLPFGLNVSQDIFQQRVDEIIKPCPGAIVIADDIVVYGKDEDDHDKNLTTFMHTAEKNGLVFNSAKCQIKCTHIDFFGNVYTTDGIKPDPKKVEDLHAMPTPTSKTELKQFMGAITYLSPFIR